jgi:hypothetical protein
MNCNAVWTDEFIRTKMPKAFIKNYMNHYSQFLYEKERKNLPIAQEILEKERLTIECVLNITHLNHKIYILGEFKKQKIATSVCPIIYCSGILDDKKRCNACCYFIPFVPDDYDEVIEKLRYECLELNKKLQDISNGVLSQERKEFSKKCIGKDCRGLFGSNMICGICGLRLCIHCHEEITLGEHTCDEKNTASIEAIKSETKLCPGCRIPTFKISGCSQMWCVECHTTWDWENGQVVTDARIHNPHYYEYKINNEGLARNPGDLVCGGLISVDKIIRNRGNRNIEFILNLHRNVLRFQDMNQTIAGENDNTLKNVDLAVEYLRKRISVKEWRTSLTKRYKLEKKGQQLKEIIAVYVDAISSMLGDYGMELLELEDLIQHSYRMENYCNDRLREIERMYDCSLNWNFLC